MNFKVKTKLLSQALKDCLLKDEEKNLVLQNISISNQNEIILESNEISVTLLSYLLKNSINLSNRIRAELSMELFGQEVIEDTSVKEIWQTKITKLSSIVECFSRIGIRKINADILFNERWYPILLKPVFTKGDRYDVAKVTVQAKILFAKESLDIGFEITDVDLRDAYGKLSKLTLEDLFKEFGCREQQCNIKKFEESLFITNKLTKKNGMQMNCHGFVIVDVHRGYISERLGYKNVKERVIIESDFEYKDGELRSREINPKNHTIYPFIRIYSFSLRRYTFVSVNDLYDYKYDDNAINRLFLPNSISSILRKVISTSQDALIGDIVTGKHGGMIIMAAGNPGVGKTSTAEVYSELQKMPLYVVEIGELGTHPRNVEENMSQILKRVERWNAIVLFDEIDVYLAERSTDLDRTAIVGIFLRLMDYFRGVMFFTTNRPSVLDYAIRSRVTLRIDYPDLDKATRQKIWNEKLNYISIKVKDGLSKISDIPLNGREIRNMVRLVHILFPNGATQKEIIDIIHTSIPEIKENIIKQNK